MKPIRSIVILRKNNADAACRDIIGVGEMSAASMSCKPRTAGMASGDGKAAHGRRASAMMRHDYARSETPARDAAIFSAAAVMSY